MDGFVQMNAGTIVTRGVLVAGEHRRDPGRCGRDDDLKSIKDASAVDVNGA